VALSAAVDPQAVSNDSVGGGLGSVAVAAVANADAEPDAQTQMVSREEGEAAKRSRASYCVGYCPNGMACIYSGTCPTVVPIWCCGTTHCCARGSRCYFNTCR